MRVREILCRIGAVHLFGVGDEATAQGERLAILALTRVLWAHGPLLRSCAVGVAPIAELHDLDDYGSLLAATHSPALGLRLLMRDPPAVRSPSQGTQNPVHASIAHERTGTRRSDAKLQGIIRRERDDAPILISFDPTRHF